MKKIGIIFAMEEELTEFLQLVTLNRQYNIYDLTIYDCKLKDKNLFLTTSGIGKVNAARRKRINGDFIFIINSVFSIEITKSLVLCGTAEGVITESS